MLVSSKHRFTFLCTPKNASNSVEAMLLPYCDLHFLGRAQFRHTTLRQYRAHVVPYLADVADLRDVETVCLVREPVAWLHSWYRFRARHRVRAERPEVSTAHLSFADFLSEYLADEPAPLARFDPPTQYEFVMDEAGAVGVDHVFPYERLDELVRFFEARVGRSLSIPWENASPSRVHSSDAVERIGDLARRALRRWAPRRAAAERHIAPPDVPQATMERLRERLARDFELHRSLTGAR